MTDNFQKYYPDLFEFSSTHKKPLSKMLEIAFFPNSTIIYDPNSTIIYEETLLNRLALEPIVINFFFRLCEHKNFAHYLESLNQVNLLTLSSECDSQFITLYPNKLGRAYYYSRYVISQFILIANYLSLNRHHSDDIIDLSTYPFPDNIKSTSIFDKLLKAIDTYDASTYRNIQEFIYATIRLHYDNNVNIHDSISALLYTIKNRFPSKFSLFDLSNLLTPVNKELSYLTHGYLPLDNEYNHSGFIQNLVLNRFANASQYLNTIFDLVPNKTISKLIFVPTPDKRDKPLLFLIDINKTPTKLDIEFNSLSKVSYDPASCDLFDLQELSDILNIKNNVYDLTTNTFVYFLKRYKTLSFNNITRASDLNSPAISINSLDSYSLNDNLTYNHTNNRLFRLNSMEDIYITNDVLHLALCLLTNY